MRAFQNSIKFSSKIRLQTVWYVSMCMCANVLLSHCKCVRAYLSINIFALYLLLPCFLFSSFPSPTHSLFLSTLLSYFPFIYNTIAYLLYSCSSLIDIPLPHFLCPFFFLSILQTFYFTFYKLYLFSIFYRSKLWIYSKTFATTNVF